MFKFPYFFLTFFLINQIRAQVKTNGDCNKFQANFNLKEVVGQWHVVAVIPGELFPKNFSVSCYRVEFSETDVAGLRWLVNQTVHTKLDLKLLKNHGGLTIRQRYHARQPFDVWSRSIGGVKGCFEQVLSLNSSNKDNKNPIAETKHAKMQLHLIDTNSKSGPLLLQMLWGKMLTGVVYRRNLDQDLEELKLALDLMIQLRGRELKLKTCEELVRDHLDESLKKNQ